MKFQKKSAIACLTLFTCVFCHMRVENLLKGHAIGTPPPVPPLMAISVFYDFPKPSTFDNILLAILSQWKPDRYKNKLRWQSYFFMFRKLQNNVTCFSYKQHFHKWQKAEIWSKIITVLSIKGSQKKNQHCKWKTSWVQKIIATKSMH